MKKIHYRKPEITKFAHAINHIRESITDGGHDPLSALYCAGIMDVKEKMRFIRYAEEVKAFDVVDSLAYERLKEIYVE